MTTSAGTKCTSSKGIEFVRTNVGVRDQNSGLEWVADALYLIRGGMHPEGSGETCRFGRLASQDEFKAAETNGFREAISVLKTHNWWTENCNVYFRGAKGDLGIWDMCYFYDGSEWTMCVR